MKSKRLLITLGLAITLLVGIGLALGGCETPPKKLKDSDSSAVVPKPQDKAKTEVNAVKTPSASAPAVTLSRTEQEAAIMEFFRKGVRAWNEKDRKEILAGLAEDAQVMDRDGSMRSKEEVAKSLGRDLSMVGQIRYRSLEIVDLGDSSAKVKGEVVFYPEGNIEISLFRTMDMVYREGRWMIKRLVYERRRW